MKTLDAEWDPANFPGSRQKRNAQSVKKQSKASVTWDQHPRHMMYRGQTVEVFTIEALAAALNRKVISIRAMERKGILCRPALKMKRGQIVSRVYTRDQIEDLIQLFVDFEYHDPSATKSYSTAFRRAAREILRRRP